MALSPEVQAFAERMQRKFDENRHKGPIADAIRTCTLPYLMRRLYEEVGELQIEVGRRAQDIDSALVADEAADVANICLLIAGHFGGVIAP